MFTSREIGAGVVKMGAITTENASNNRKAFESYAWIPCFVHNLQLDVKAVGLNRVSTDFSMHPTTLFGLSRSTKQNDEELEGETKDLEAS